MDLRQLQQFVAVSETLSFRKAAEALHMSQPPLSIAIRRLEEEVGAVLFRRTRRGVTLTPVGEAILSDAKRALHYARQVNHIAQRAQSGEVGLLRIGFVGSASYSVLPRVIRIYRERHPEIRLELFESTTRNITQMLENRKLDVGLIRTPSPISSCVERFVVEHERFVAVLPSDHRLARRKTLRLEELKAEPFVFFSGEEVPGMNAMATLLCQDAGFTPHVVQEAVQIQTLVSLVSAGMGVTLVPAVSARVMVEGVVYKELKSLPSHLSVGLAAAFHVNADSPLIQNFKRCLNQKNG